MNLTDNTVQQSEASVNAEIPQERLGRVLLQVGFWRGAYARAKGTMEARQNAFELANAEAILAAASARTQLASAETEARDLAVQIYAETGSKQPHAGVGIRVTTRMVYDRHIAFDWAIDHHMALGLDVKAFEGIAKTGVAGSFVTFTEEPTATISSDLTKALGIEPAAGGGSE